MSHIKKFYESISDDFSEVYHALREIEDEDMGLVVVTSANGLSTYLKSIADVDDFSNYFKFNLDGGAAGTYRGWKFRVDTYGIKSYDSFLKFLNGMNPVIKRLENMGYTLTKVENRYYTGIISMTEGGGNFVDAVEFIF